METEKSMIEWLGREVACFYKKGDVIKSSCFPTAESIRQFFNTSGEDWEVIDKKLSEDQRVISLTLRAKRDVFE